jgi:hypothetical protein
VKGHFLAPGFIFSVRSRVPVVSLVPFSLPLFFFYAELFFLQASVLRSDFFDFLSQVPRSDFLCWARGFAAQERAAWFLLESIGR